MDCNIIKDLIPLYADDCCSEESRQTVEVHIGCCPSCAQYLEDVQTPAETVAVSKPDVKMNRLNDWKASILQSALMLVSFIVITVGVALEAHTTIWENNGFWAYNLVVPATGFLVSMSNWYFIKQYKSRKSFSRFTLALTLICILGAFGLVGWHYGFFRLLAWVFSHLDYFGYSFTWWIKYFVSSYGMGVLLTAVFGALSKTLSVQYAKALGKE